MTILFNIACARAANSLAIRTAGWRRRQRGAASLSQWARQPDRCADTRQSYVAACPLGHLSLLL
eukprot:6174403-Pleurochrysis_carterae.AAC.5